MVDGHSFRLSKMIYARYPFEELQKRFNQIDLIVIDFDECVFPHFSQTTLGKLIFWEILFNPLEWVDLKFLPSLLFGGFFICLSRIRHRLSGIVDNLEMMKGYEETMMGIPLLYFKKAAVRIPPRSYFYSKVAIEELSKQAKIGIISFGVDIIMEEYMKQLNGGGKCCVSFYNCNILRFERKGAREVFVGYRRDELKTNKIHKGELLERRIKQFNAKTPLVIGHNEDDTEMVKIAQVMNGIGIGFNPLPEVEHAFDIKVFGKDWEYLCQLVKKLRQGQKSSCEHSELT
jgi:hypothetical protein